jgi:putative membrane fusion protein
MKEKNAKEKRNKTIEFPVERRNRNLSGKSAMTRGKPAQSKGAHNEKQRSAKQSEAASSKGSTARRITYGSVLVILFMLLYIPSMLNWLSGNSITQDVIRNGIIENHISFNAVIIRDEVLLEPSAISGRCITEIDEGERTAAYSRIATVTNDTSDELLQEMERLNARIVKVQMEKAEKADFFSEDLAKLDNEIALEVQDMILACNARDFDKMGKTRDDIFNIVEKKAEIVGKNSTDSYIESLLTQKEIIQEKIYSNTTEVRSNISGIVSYTIDGYEGELSPQNLDSLTPEYLDKVIERDAQRQTATGRVQAGLPVAKIIRGTDTYIAASIPKEKAVDFEEGKNIKLRVNDIGLETNGSIVKVNSYDNGKTVVSIRMSRGAEFLSTARVVNVDFISTIEEGLKVPLKSLRNISEDGTRGTIMLNKYNVAAARTVDIVCSDDEYAIIRTPEEDYGKSGKTVNLYDTYIMNPDRIEEGDIIDR